jgi:hypothetical protein
VTKARPQTYLIRYEIRGDKSNGYKRLGFFEGAVEAKWALRGLRYLEATCPSVFSHLDGRFWLIFAQTMRFSPTNFAYLNMEIKRCRV